MLTNLATGVLGILFFLFLFWRRLKEDYASQIIFKAATNILVGVLLGFLISKKLFPTWFIFFELLGAFVGLVYSIYNLKVRFYETLEAIVLAFLPWLALFFISHSVEQSSLTSFLGFLIILAVIFLFYYLDTSYKKFAWYTSGRVGFVGLATLGVLFIVRAAVATFNVSVLSFVGRFEGIVSGCLAAVCMIGLFRLSKNK